MIFLLVFAVITLIFYVFSIKKAKLKLSHKIILLVVELLYNITMPITVTAMFERYFSDYFNGHSFLAGLGCVIADMIIIVILFIAEALLHGYLPKIKTNAGFVSFVIIFFVAGIIAAWSLNYLLESPNTYKGLF